MFHSDPTGSLQAFLLLERQRVARRGVPHNPAAPSAAVYCPRRRLRFRLRCACGRAFLALGRRLLQETAGTAPAYRQPAT